MPEPPGRIELKDDQGITYFTSEYLPDKGWIFSNWSGRVSDTQVKEGANANLDLVEKFGCSLLLNDNTQLSGNWTASNDWIEQDWMPRAASLGLTHIAHVFSPNFITKFSAVDLGTRQMPIQFKTFDDILSAESWLELHRP